MKSDLNKLQHNQIWLHFAQVMLGGKNIEEGFGIAYRVIQVSVYDSSVMV